MSYVQRGPIPMIPSVIFSLGATEPSAPSACAGRNLGTANAVLAAKLLCRNLRRVACH